MSRHRLFKNLNIKDELDDDALSDGGEDLTDEQYAQMHDGLEKIRHILGGEGVSGLSDKDIKDALWEYYFDVDKSLQWALDEQQRRHLAYERKEPDFSKDLPPVPQANVENPSNIEYYNPEQFHDSDPATSMERSRIPLIVLAQQQPGYNMPTDSPDYQSPLILRPTLSTITERTERTEATPRWPGGRRLIPSHKARAPSSNATSSYGEALVEPDHRIEHTPEPPDPNHIPVSPPASALNELSLYEPAPSLAASDSKSNLSSLRPSSLPVPATDGLPEIPDYVSKLSGQVPAPKKSKLSLLASSRASTPASQRESFRSSGPALSGSVKTFPALRPSTQSAQPPGSLTSSDAPSAQRHNGQSPSLSSTSSLVRRAIQTAIDLEAIDREAPKPRFRQKPTKAEVATIRQSTAASSSDNTSVHPYKEVNTFGPPADRPPSKLAMLALAKANSSKGLRLPKPVTEYLTPIANGPTVTTAITTSYQNLQSLTDPTLSRIIPEQYVVPLGALPLPPEKGSKLAMKLKKANEKQDVAYPQGGEVTPALSPIFPPKTSAHIRALPSAFASLLIDDPLPSFEVKKKDRASRRRRNKTNNLSVNEETGLGTRGNSKSRSQRHKSDHLPVLGLSSPLGFQFDGPSPDDVVFNARRGTSLSQQKDIPLSTSTPNKRSSQ